MAIPKIWIYFLTENWYIVQYDEFVEKDLVHIKLTCIDKPMRDPLAHRDLNSIMEKIRHFTKQGLMITKIKIEEIKVPEDIAYNLKERIILITLENKNRKN